MKEVININSLESYTSNFLSLLIDYSPKFISAVLLLIIGLYAIKITNKIVKKVMVKNNFDPTLSKFLADILLWALRVLLFVTVISKLGIDNSSFVAILGAAGLAVGLSLQGSLSNFAGGMLIILFKPFRVGDTIEAQGIMGSVSEIQIFVTKIISANNQTIFIPNGALSNNTIINYSIQENRRTDLTLSISYDTNIKLARETVLELMKNNPKILSTPAATVTVRDFSDQAIHLSVRAWCSNPNFAEVSSYILENCKDAFDDKNIAIHPFVKEKSS
jgi:small conductance mechanosensitive channel